MYNDLWLYPPVIRKGVGSVAAMFFVCLFVCLAMSLLSKPIKSMKTNVNDVNVFAMGACTYVYVDY